MSADTVAAIVAFFAFGANFLGTVFLLLIRPGSRAIRWFAFFWAGILAWLGLQGWMFARQEIGGLGVWYEATVHMLPGLFLAATMVDELDWSSLRAWGIVAVSAALLPFSIGGLIGDGPSWFVYGWQLFGWGIGTVLHLLKGHRRRRLDPEARRRLATAVFILLGIMAPGSVILGWLVGGNFFVFAMPLITVAIQVLILLGVLQLQFYSIEVRAGERGAVAARGAELERLAVVGELAASFAHEVRNPLTGVRSLAQRLAEEEIGEEKRRDYADLIVREVGRVEQIVANLLGIARRPAAANPAGTSLRIPLEPLFEDVRLLVGSRAEMAGVEVRLAADGVEARVSREPLAQILLNLLLNALAHSPDGGAVELVARRDGERVGVLVRDQGPGIPEDERTRVFEPLYSRTGGTGLGLAVVRRIADEQGWTIALGDAPGGGAEFRVMIPA